MKAIMEQVLAGWNAYWGESRYLWLWGAAFLCLLLFYKKEKNAANLVRYQVLMAVMYFFPITAGVIQKCVGAEVYWRVIWLFPVVPVIAYACTLGVKQAPGKTWRAVLTAVCIAAAVFAGRSVWQAGNYEKTVNRQQVPDEVAEACRIITENRISSDSRVAADDHIASYLRVYDPSVKMSYGRRGESAISKSAAALYEEIQAPERDYEKIAERARETDCQFLVFRITSDNAAAEMEKYGFSLIGSAADYGVFQEN